MRKPASAHAGAAGINRAIDSAEAVARLARRLEQFQQKCAAVLRPELCKNKELKRFRVSVKNGNALAAVRKGIMSSIFIAGRAFITEPG
ncbi:hypothetical protein CYK37_22620 [Mesorhizobium loti]|nr:hypothetical protein CYK37_22620 [Mesorhizobium loti]